MKDFKGVVYPAVKPKYKDNPFNILAVTSYTWQGQSGSVYNPRVNLEYCTFENPFYGVRAFFKLIRNYQVLHFCLTLKQIISRYCPDDITNYLLNVTTFTGWNEDRVITLSDYVDLGVAMSKTEGFAVSREFLEYVYNNITI